jgi:RNA polymerase sigma factor CnrH
MSDPQTQPDKGANDRRTNLSRQPGAVGHRPGTAAKRWSALVDMVAVGEEDFDRAVAEHHQRIRLLVYRLLGWRDGIEDVVQDVFLAAWMGWPRVRDRSSVELWLKRIAVNKCRSRLRRETVRRRWLGWMRGVFSNQSQAPADQLLEKQEQAERVRSAIRMLEPVYREATVLHYLEQLDIDEIAEILGVRRNTVEVRLHRARRQLEKILCDMTE